MARSGSLPIGENQPKNIFVTQINERDDDDDQIRQVPVVQESGNALIETGLNTLQKTLVLKREAEHAQINKELLAVKTRCRDRMEICSKRRMELQRKQQEIKDQVSKFDQFIRENETKRRRAMMKFLEESKLREIKTKEEQDLKVELELVKEQHKKIVHKVKHYQKFEQYLQKVIKILPPDYVKADDNVLSALMSRHNTLSETHDELLTQMNGRSDELKQLREEYHEVKEQHNGKVLSLNSTLSKKHHEREMKSDEVQRIEQSLRYKEGDMRSQIEDFGVILRAIGNITDKCLKKYDLFPSDMTSDQKLEKIEEYITDITEIIGNVEAEMAASEGRRSAKSH